MDNSFLKLAASFGLFFAAFAGFFWECFVIWKLWFWYGVPLGGVPISFGAVVAFSLIFYMNTAHLRPKRDQNVLAMAERLYQSIGGASLAFILGWLLK